MKTYYKDFASYDEAYFCYAEIVSGRDKDRKNPSIFFLQGSLAGFRVAWMDVTP